MRISFSRFRTGPRLESAGDHQQGLGFVEKTLVFVGRATLNVFRRFGSLFDLSRTNGGQAGARSIRLRAATRSMGVTPAEEDEIVAVFNEWAEVDQSHRKLARRGGHDADAGMWSRPLPPAHPPSRPPPRLGIVHSQQGPGQTGTVTHRRGELPLTPRSNRNSPKRSRIAENERGLANSPRNLSKDRLVALLAS